MERKTQLSEQEVKILKKDQIARSMSLVPRFDEREVEKYVIKKSLKRWQRVWNAQWTCTVCFYRVY